VINNSGTVIDKVLSGIDGALGGLNFSVTGQRIIFLEMYLDMKMLTDSSIPGFTSMFFTATTTDIGLDKPSGTLDLDVRLSPSESELIFVTSNDGLSVNCKTGTFYK
jgi:hypothetical protein